MKKDFLMVPKIAAWHDTLQKNGCTVSDVTALYLHTRQGGELVFALLSAEATAPDTTRLLPIIFIRGHACIIVPLLINQDTGEKKFLMVLQRRIATGALSLEFPAGMLDANITQPRETALKELTEETGLILRPEQLFPLADTLLFSSPGASDEGIYYYGCVHTVEDRTFRSCEGRRTGDASENEHMQVTLRTKNEIITGTNSLQARLGICLFEDYCVAHNIATDAI